MSRSVYGPACVSVPATPGMKNGGSSTSGAPPASTNRPNGSTSAKPSASASAKGESTVPICPGTLPSGTTKPRRSRAAIGHSEAEASAYASFWFRNSPAANSSVVRGRSACALSASVMRNGGSSESFGCDVASSCLAARKSCWSCAAPLPSGPSTASDAFVNARRFGYPSADRTAPSPTWCGRYPRRPQMRDIAAFASSLSATDASARASARVDDGKSGSPFASNGFDSYSGVSACPSFIRPWWSRTLSPSVSVVTSSISTSGNIALNERTSWLRHRAIARIFAIDRSRAFTPSPSGGGSTLSSTSFAYVPSAVG